MQMQNGGRARGLLHDGTWHMRRRKVICGAPSESKELARPVSLGLALVEERLNCEARGPARPQEHRTQHARRAALLATGMRAVPIARSKCDTKCEFALRVGSHTQGPRRAGFAASWASAALEAWDFAVLWRW